MKKRVKKNWILAVILIVIVLAVAYIAYNYTTKGVLFSPGVIQISVVAQPVYTGPQNAVRAMCPAPTLVMKNDAGVQVFSFDYTKLGLVETVTRGGSLGNLGSFFDNTSNLNFYFTNDCCFQGDCALGTDIRIYNITINGKTQSVNTILTIANQSVNVGYGNGAVNQTQTNATTTNQTYTNNTIIGGNNTIYSNNTLIGYNNTINGLNNTIYSNNTYVNGSNNFVSGSNNSIIGWNNTILGSNNTVISGNNTIYSNNTYVNGSNNFVNGINNTIIGWNNTVIGRNNTIIGNNNTLYRNNTIVRSNNTRLY